MKTLLIQHVVWLGGKDEIQRLLVKCSSSLKLLSLTPAAEAFR